MNLQTLEKKYKAKLKEASELSKQINTHLHSYFDDKLKTYNDFESFLFEVNEYAGDSLGKLIYIKYAKDFYDREEKIKEKAKQEQV